MERNDKGQFLKGRRPSPATEFKKGHIPHNKGKRREEWLSEDDIKVIERTQFKAGNLPPNIEPPGYVSMVAHKRRGVVCGYDWYINIDRYGNRHTHYNYRKYLWEVENDRDAPEGAIFVALNGDQKSKPTIENVEMIDRKELLRRNLGRRT